MIQVKVSVLRFVIPKTKLSRSQWPRGLRRGCAAARLLGLRVRIPSGVSLSVCCECCVLLGRGLYDELITLQEESCRVWCVWVWPRILDNEEDLAHWVLLCRGQIKDKSRVKELNFQAIELKCNILNDAFEDLLVQQHLFGFTECRW